jgi:hypothetical protein
LRNVDGTFTLVNHEDNFAVSRVTFEKTFKPTKGEYLLNLMVELGGYVVLQWLQLLKWFWTIVLTCGESGEESRTMV